MSERFWWLVGAIVIVVVLVLAWVFFRPRPITSARQMPTTVQEKMKRFQEKMGEARRGMPIQPGQ